jgi:hypothetical protein
MPVTRTRRGSAITPVATSSIGVKPPNPALPFPFNFIPSVSGVSLPNLPGPFDEGANFFAKLTDSMTWVRVGEFVAGGVLVYMGLRQFAKVYDVNLPGIKDAVSVARVAAI